ncbi:MAG: FIST signal transduction protein [Acidobacteriota bacterium]
MIARNVSSSSLDAEVVARELARGLADPSLRFACVFADWRIEPARLAHELQRALSPAPVAGCTTIGVVSAASDATAAALGFYGDWLRVGIGIAPELSKSPLARSRDAVSRAAGALGATPETLDPSRHVALAFVDGSCGHEEAFCIGSAAAAPQIRVVGGSAATELGSTRRSFVWALGEAISDAGIVIVLDSAHPYHVVASSHLVATELKTVVTAASGRVVDELDGRPAAERLRAMVAQLGETLDDRQPSQVSLARFVGGAPYVRSITRLDGPRIQLASAVEVGHVLQLMRPGDLIGRTRRDLDEALDRVGGELAALLAFSCIGRHWEAASRGLTDELARTYAAYPTTGFQSYGEQTGMLLVNHTLTGLAIGAAPR